MRFYFGLSKDQELQNTCQSDFSNNLTDQQTTTTLKQFSPSSSIEGHTNSTDKKIMIILSITQDSSNKLIH
jgi:hypothetical protein